MKGFIRFGVLVAGICAAMPAFAVGFINLKWDDCNGTANKTYACDVTTGFFDIIASFDPGVNYNTGQDVIIADVGLVDVIATSLSATTLPPFWQFQTGGCQGPTKLLFSADFSAQSGACFDLWAGGAGGGGQYGGKAGPTPEGNTARIKWTWAVDPAAPVTADAGTEYYVSKLRVTKISTTCAGCSDPVCLVYNQERFSLLRGGAPVDINYSSDGVTPPYVTWQDTGNTTFNCPAPTSVKVRTWGEIKSLYR